MGKYHGVYKYKSKFWVRIIKNNQYNDGGHYYSEEDAAIVADYISISLNGDLVIKNFPDLSVGQLENMYTMIQKQYGETKELKRSKGGQGIVRCSNKLSKYIGVSKDKNNWTARIKFRGKQEYLGNFETEEDAAMAYDKRAVEIYGLNAKINIKIV